MNHQGTSNQKGEIEFRRKLYLQQVEQEKIFEDEFNAEGIENILSARMQKTLKQMISLQEDGTTLSPYIEIGAERGQRSLIMENDLMMNGAAVDISHDMLRSCDYYMDVFNKSNSPLRICCDANNLPFITNSVPFVFCYETLHHFPEPTPIAKEVYRVLSPGGCFFFDEEPFRQVLHINLYRGKKIYSKESLSRSTYRKVVDYFLRERLCNETEHGVIENDEISIKTWTRVLSLFDEKNVSLKVPKLFQVKLFNPNSYLKYFAAYLLGGSISGVCKKAGNISSKKNSIYDTLICPSCNPSDAEVLLKRNPHWFCCPKCSKKYPIVDGVLFLFSYTKFEELYPEIFDAFQSKYS
jgi:ubiquinone/menaquinone biosynthesis C-methylase UbiE/uncharacterized protein YbaR (Trm112 family)